MKLIIGSLIVFQMIVATVAFSVETETECKDGIQAGRTTGEGNQDSSTTPVVTPDATAVQK